MSGPLQELRARLAEGADLRRAAGVLGWEQRVTMPPRGTEARADQLATLGRIAHERFVDDEVGRLLDAAEPLVESLPYDSDDRSLVRVTRRDWEKARRVPTELRVEMTRAAARGHHAWVEARRTNDFASFLPYLRTNVELKRRYIECFEWSDSPYTRAPRRLRARDGDDRGARGVRGPSPRPHRDRRGGARGRRVVPQRRLRPGRAARVRGARRRDARLRGRGVAARPDRAPVLHLVHEPRRPAHDPLPAERPRVRLVDAARGRPRALRARDRRLAAPDAARHARRRSASTSRRAGRGRTSSAEAGRSGSTGTSRSRRRSRPCARSSSRTSSARSTARSRGSSASTPTRRPTASTSSSASSSSRS